jgi:hypothetical protein
LQGRLAVLIELTLFGELTGLPRFDTGRSTQADLIVRAAQLALGTAELARICAGSDTGPVIAHLSATAAELAAEHVLAAILAAALVVADLSGCTAGLPDALTAGRALIFADQPAAAIRAASLAAWAAKPSALTAGHTGGAGITALAQITDRGRFTAAAATEPIRGTGLLLVEAVRVDAIVAFVGAVVGILVVGALVASIGAIEIAEIRGLDVLIGELRAITGGVGAGRLRIAAGHQEQGERP